jgi:hypothetical protein
MADLERAIQRWTGNRAAPIDISRADLGEMLKASSGLLHDADRHGIQLVGSPVKQLTSMPRQARARKGTAA